MNSNKKYEDLTGMSMKDFGIPDSRWKVIKRAADRVDKKGAHLRVWLCECSCEQHTRKEVLEYTLKNGMSLSCGCLRKENTHKKLFIDMTGWVMYEHGVSDSRLTVIKRVDDYIRPDGYHTSQWLCECSCKNHNHIITTGEAIRSGHTLSCGCLNKERASSALIKRRTTHGESDTRLFQIWQGIHKRCENKNAYNYYLYGARGISVCEEWSKYLPFAKWARENGYTDELTIERKNVNGDYDPNNCTWATNKEQQNNKRNNHYITYNNETHTISE